MKMDIDKYQINYNSGFTLVELSIVIVIISLITAGIFSGQKLVNNAKLNNVIKEIREFDTATHQFKEKFKYYPGDLPNAASYWGTYSAGPPITGASNGNGNWVMNWSSDPTETVMFWRQLALAGFIPGTYSGAGPSVLGVSVPKSVISGGGYDIDYDPAYSTVGNFIEFGSLTGNWGGLVNGQVISPADAYLIDTKMDDGLAASGNLYTLRSVAYDATANKCTSASGSAATATYVLTDKTISCRMFWWLDKNR